MRPSSLLYAFGAASSAAAELQALIGAVAGDAFATYASVMAWTADGVHQVFGDLARTAERKGL